MENTVSTSSAASSDGNDFKQCATKKEWVYKKSLSLTTSSTCNSHFCWVCYIGAQLSATTKPLISRTRARILVGLFVTSATGETSALQMRNAHQFVWFSTLECRWTESPAMLVCPRNTAQWWQEVSCLNVVCSLVWNFAPYEVNCSRVPKFSRHK